MIAQNRIVRFTLPGNNIKLSVIYAILRSHNIIKHDDDVYLIDLQLSGATRTEIAVHLEN